MPELSTKRLLTMTWLEGRRLLDYTGRPLEERNQIARAMFRAWWYPFSHYGVIHGDPHLGNYTVFEDGEGRAAGINLLDYGCMRTFAPKFIQGVIDLYHGLLRGERALVVHAYETWGFGGLSNELIDILNIWARFIYGPMLDDRVRTIADQVSPGMYGRQEAFRVHQGLRDKGPVKVPREFVFMDRAAIGLGGVFLHLGAELNYHRLFEDTIAGADLADVAERQRAAFTRAGVPLPEGASARGVHPVRRAAARGFIAWGRIALASRFEAVVVRTQLTPLSSSRRKPGFGQRLGSSGSGYTGLRRYDGVRGLLRKRQPPSRPAGCGRADCCPERRFLLFPAGRGNKASVRGEWNAYRPERVPSGDGLRRAPEDLQAVHQAHAGDHCRRGRAHGVPLHLRGLSRLKVPA